MSNFKAEVIKIDNMEKHPNADTLSIVRVYGGFPCLIRTDDFSVGDLAAYVLAEPVSLVPTDLPEFSFLKDKAKDGLAKIKPIRLRGVFSMGLLIPARLGWKEGQDVTKELGIERYEKLDHLSSGGDSESSPSWFIKYTDIESFRKWHSIFEGEVIINEKIEGTNARFAYRDRLWVGSHTQAKKLDGDTWWTHVAKKLELEDKLKNFPDLIFFGEVYGGSVQKKKYMEGPPYGKAGLELLIFDVFDLNEFKYLDYDKAKGLAEEAGFDWVPELYRGPFTSLADFEPLADGQSLIADHIREGFVIRPSHEKYNDKLGRVIAKLHGQEFLLKK